LGRNPIPSLTRPHQLFTSWNSKKNWHSSICARAKACHSHHFKNLCEVACCPMIWRSYSKLPTMLQIMMFSPLKVLIRIGFPYMYCIHKGQSFRGTHTGRVYVVLCNSLKNYFKNL
jgi:hypothetical protein